MPDSPTGDSKSHLSCVWDYATRTVCAEERFYREHEGRRYCVLHFPGKDKVEDFEAAFLKKIRNEDFDFRGVYFPGDLSLSREIKSRVNFSEATFSGRVGFE